MSSQDTLRPAGLFAGLAAALLLLGGPHPVSAQAASDAPTSVQVRIGVAAIEYLETRYNTRAGEPEGVAISRLSARGPSGDQVAFDSAEASEVARLVGRPLVTGRWMCGADPSIRLTWATAIEERSEGEAVVEAVQAASTDQRHGTIFHRLRLEETNGAWKVADVVSTFSTHGECGAP